MALRKRRLTPAEQAQLELEQRGVIATHTGYTPFPWDIHPVDQYIRVPPSGPLSQKWDGVQQVNEISKVGMLRSAIYGGLPDNPMQSHQTRTERINQVNWLSFSFGAGPVTAQDQNEATQEYWNDQATPAQPSFLQSFLARLKGRI